MVINHLLNGMILQALFTGQLVVGVLFQLQFYEFFTGPVRQLKKNVNDNAMKYLLVNARILTMGRVKPHRIWYVYIYIYSCKLT